MALHFTKMHGLGNDFVVIDAITQDVALTPERVRRIAHRRLGVGCDQVLLIELAPGPEVDFGYRIFNADGNEVEQCGNGARCFARYVRDTGLTDRDEISVATRGGRIVLHLREDGQVSVDMGIPQLEPALIPFEAPAEAPSYLVEVDGETVELAAVSMGNPHAVLRVDNVQTAPVARLGPLLETHPRFPRHVNVGFMQVVARDRIRLRVHERGTGETLACGTGACAAVVAGQLQGLLDTRVQVELPGGTLVIEWPGRGQTVIKTGPATTVFTGLTEL
jgi:diaminopimelate epimerase